MTEPASVPVPCLPVNAQQHFVPGDERTVIIDGRPHRFRFTRSYVESDRYGKQTVFGEHYRDDALIFISCDVPEPKLLELIIHETLHALCEGMPEAEVLRIGRNIQHVLTTLGVRSVRPQPQLRS